MGFTQLPGKPKPKKRVGRPKKTAKERQLEGQLKDGQAVDIYGVPLDPANSVGHRLELMRMFCEGLKETGTVSRACERSGISSQTAYYWRGKYEAFKKSWEAAYSQAADKLEDRVYERALNDNDKNSAILAMFLLKGFRPDKHREHWKGELTGANGSPLQFTRLAGMTEAEIDDLIKTKGQKPQ